MGFFTCLTWRTPPSRAANPPWRCRLQMAQVMQTAAGLMQGWAGAVAARFFPSIYKHKKHQITSNNQISFCHQLVLCQAPSRPARKPRSCSTNFWRMVARSLIWKSWAASSRFFSSKCIMRFYQSQAALVLAGWPSASPSGSLRPAAASWPEVHKEISSLPEGGRKISKKILNFAACFFRRVSHQQRLLRTGFGGAPRRHGEVGPVGCHSLIRVQRHWQRIDCSDGLLWGGHSITLHLVKGNMKPLAPPSAKK